VIKIGLLSLLVAIKSLQAQLPSNFPKIYNFAEAKSSLSFKIKAKLISASTVYYIDAVYSSKRGIEKIQSSLEINKDILRKILLNKVRILKDESFFKLSEQSNYSYSKIKNILTLTKKEDLGTTETQYFFEKKKWSEKKNVLLRVEQTKYEGKNRIKTTTKIKYKKMLGETYVVDRVMTNVLHGVGLDDSDNKGRKFEEEFIFSKYSL